MIKIKEYVYELMNGIFKVMLKLVCEQIMQI